MYGFQRLVSRVLGSGPPTGTLSPHVHPQHRSIGPAVLADTTTLPQGAVFCQIYSMENFRKIRANPVGGADQALSVDGFFAEMFGQHVIDNRAIFVAV